MSAILLTMMSIRASIFALAEVSISAMHRFVSFVLLFVVTGVNHGCRLQGQWDGSPDFASTATWDDRGHQQWDGFPTSPPPPSTIRPQPAQNEAYRVTGTEPKHGPFATSAPYAKLPLTGPTSLAVVPNNH